jgi:hypothetical protein
MPPAGLADGAGVDEAGIVIRARRVSAAALPADTALTKSLAVVRSERPGGGSGFKNAPEATPEVAIVP